MLGHGYNRAELLVINDSLETIVANNNYSAGIAYCNLLISERKHPSLKRYGLINKSRLFIKSRINLDSVLIIHNLQEKLYHDDEDSLDLYLNGRQYELLGHYYFLKGDIDNALAKLHKADSAYAISSSINSRIYNLNMLGTMYKLYHKEADALLAFLQAEFIIDHADNPDVSIMIDLFIDMGMLYFNLGDYVKAEAYYKRLANYTLTPLQEAQIANNMGIIELENELYEKAIADFYNALELYRLIGDTAELSLTYNNLAILLIDYAPEHDSILPYLNKSIVIKKRYGNRTGLVSSYIALAQYYVIREDYSACNNVLSMLNALWKDCTAQDKQLYYHFKYLISNASGKTAEALEYYKNYHFYTDSVRDNNISNDLQRTEVLFELQNKQKELEMIETKAEVAELQVHRQRFITLGTVGISLAAIILLSSILYFNQKKQRLEKQLMARKVKLAAVANLVKGQEEERLRLAKELHDGVGNALAVMRAKAAKCLNNEDAKKLNELINKTTDELRQISHNLMPYTVERFGLKRAIEDLAESWQDVHDGLLIETALCGDFSQINKDASLTLYRIIQELLSNAVLHGNSKYVIIDLLLKDGIVKLTFEDDGTGMDVRIWEEGRGRGLENIKNRVAYLNGTANVKSDLSGTRYTFTFQNTKT